MVKVSDMLKSLRILWSVALWLGFASAGFATGERWSYVAPDHPKFGTGFHGVAIQYDDSFARLQYIPHRNLWFSTIGVIPSEEVTEVTSILTRKDGTRLRLTLSGPEIKVETDPTGRITLVNFIIRQEDIRHFKAAISWTIETNQNRHVYSMNGSAAAIQEVATRR